MPSFRFFDQKHHRALEEEFRALYQEPGLALFAIGLAATLVIFGVFYALDYLNGTLPLFGGIQSFRIVVVICCALTVAWVVTFKAVALRHYTLVVNVVSFVVLQSAAYVAYQARIQTTYAELYWALTSSMVSGTIVIFGFARVTVFNSLVLSLTGTFAAILYALQAPAHGQQIGRLVTHLSLATVVCYLLRYTIEQRERELFLTGKDALQRAKYVQQLEVERIAADKADEAKTRFLASMSHEVRTPMNAILQILEIVSDRLEGDDRRLIDRGRASGQALLRVLNAILDYAKVSNGKATVDLAPVNLIAVVQTVVDLFQACASSKGVDLRQVTRVAAGCEVVLTDEVKLVEILSNLVSNAVKCTSNGSVEIVLEVGRIGDSLLVEFRVRDTGCGIPEEHMINLFTPFFQIPGESAGLRGGTGLGLAIVRELVSALNGKVSGRSVWREGTEMIVTLPAGVATAEPAQASPDRGGGSCDPEGYGSRAQGLRAVEPDCSKGRVLLVEDNELNAELAMIMIGTLRFSVVLAKNGTECIDHIKQSRFDIVLMDCLMPGMDGFEATKRIRASDAARTPIIGVTANTLIGDREKCLAAGMDDFLGKPYTLRELSAVLGRWVRPLEETATTSGAE